MEVAGKIIKSIRPMTMLELEAEGWDSLDSCITIEFDDGTLLYPSRDEEGNGPGRFFGVNTDGKHFGIF